MMTIALTDLQNQISNEIPQKSCERLINHTTRWRFCVFVRLLHASQFTTTKYIIGACMSGDTLTPFAQSHKILRVVLITSCEHLNTFLSVQRERGRLRPYSPLVDTKIPSHIERPLMVQPTHIYYTLHNHMDDAARAGATPECSSVEVNY